MEPEKIVFKFLDGEREDEVAAFQQAQISIGRAAGSNLSFRSTDHKMVSTHHALIREHKFGFEIVDLHSTNGTFVNGKAVSEQVIKSGDIIRLGKTGPELEVTIPADTSEQTVMETMQFGPDFGQGEDSRNTSLTDPEISTRITRIRHFRFIRKTMLLAIGMAAGFAGFAWTTIEGLELSPAPLYFKSALILIVGGVLSALVFAIYHGRPGRQKFQASEITWLSVILVLSITGVFLLWKGA